MVREVEQAVVTRWQRQMNYKHRKRFLLPTGRRRMALFTRVGRAGRVGVVRSCYNCRAFYVANNAKSQFSQNWLFARGRSHAFTAC